MPSRRAIELRERELDARPGLALGPVDLLGHSVLVLAEPLVQLVDRATSVVGLELELLECAREGLACACLELLTEPQRGDTKAAGKQPRSGPRVDPNDPVEEASWESFPASDPPSFNPAPRAAPGSEG